MLVENFAGFVAGIGLNAIKDRLNDKNSGSDYKIAIFSKIL